MVNWVFAKISFNKNLLFLWFSLNQNIDWALSLSFQGLNQNAQLGPYFSTAKKKPSSKQKRGEHDFERLLEEKIKKY